MSQRSDARKRKRSLSTFNSSAAGPSSSQVASDAINPRSYAESTLKQFQTAGLDPSEALPSSFIPDFPHRPLPASGEDGGSEDPDEVSPLDDEDLALLKSDALQDEMSMFGSAPFSEDGEAGRPTTANTAETTEAEEARASKTRARTLKKDRLHERAIGTLVAILRRCLAANDAPRARRAFAAILRTRVMSGGKVDLRHDNYWALGLEVLRLEGRLLLELVAGSTAEEGEHNPPRWIEYLRAAPPTNLDQVKAYFEALIRLHPWRKHPAEFVSALDFYPAMFGYEMASIYGEHRAGIDRVEAEAELWDLDDYGINFDMKPVLDEDGMITDREDDRFRGGDAREERLRRELDRLRKTALSRLKEVAERMDERMEVHPYSKDHEILRLRAMVALYMADLLLPPSPRSTEEEEAGKAAQAKGREYARKLFQKMMAGNDGHLEDQWIKDFVQTPDSDDDESEERRPAMFSSLPVFSSLPIR